MRILGLEFSTDHRGVAVFDTERERVGLAVQIEGRATDAFGLIEKALADAEVSRKEIDRIAVGLGPGSYTGIRNAIAIAQGWQFATGAETFGFPSMQSLAWDLRGKGRRGLVRLAVDAQRGEFYANDWMLDDTEAVEVEPLRILSPDGLFASLKAEQLVIGPDVNRLPTDGMPPNVGMEAAFPSAEMLTRIASNAAGSGKPAETLAPVYLREISFVKAPPPRIRL